MNTSNCRIWDTVNPYVFQPTSLRSPKVAFQCGFTATFILDPFFFEAAKSICPETCFLTAVAPGIEPEILGSRSNVATTGTRPCEFFGYVFSHLSASVTRPRDIRRAMLHTFVVPQLQQRERLATYWTLCTAVSAKTFHPEQSDYSCFSYRLATSFRGP